MFIFIFVYEIFSLYTTIHQKDVTEGLMLFIYGGVRRIENSILRKTCSVAGVISICLYQDSLKRSIMHLRFTSST